MKLKIIKYRTYGKQTFTKQKKKKQFGAKILSIKTKNKNI